MGRLLIVSNRLPINVSKIKDKIRFQPSIGGVATGLASFYKKYNGIWLGWPGISPKKINEQEKAFIKEELERNNCYPVFLSQHEIEYYYAGFSNKTIWPLFHYFTEYALYRKNFWEAYKKGNRTFAEVIFKYVKPGDKIWIHDYHFLLLPGILREKLPDATIGFFLHIPFPSYEIFSMIPWRKEILNGLLGADLIGFHTYEYVKCFLESTTRILGYEQNFLQIAARNRVVMVDAFPMGIDYNRFAKIKENLDVQKMAKKNRKKVGKNKIILSIDRLDYAKGIRERLQAYDLFLEKNSEYRRKVTMILVTAPSRTKVERYIMLKKDVDELVGRINGKYGTIDWMPIWYMYRTLPFNVLVAFYQIADIALITPLRDGMNLMAKEFIATKSDGKGVLILSEMAGAAEELGEAIIVNPNNIEEMADALREALTLTEEEQIERNKLMQHRLKHYNIERWAKDFMERLSNIKEIQRKLDVKRLTKKMKESLLKDYVKAKRCLLLLDYDGTLVPFVKRPEKALPDIELLDLIRSLTKKAKNEVVIVSGRKRETLDKWFRHLKLGLISDHGVWIKRKGVKWEMIEPLENQWKEEIKPILEHYAERTPGSFIEDKEFSLAWHYRTANPELAKVRAKELKDTILHLTINLDLEVLEGNKVVEIKNFGTSKGRGVLKWLSDSKWDFVLAIGDDWTDEEVFEVLPEWAYSIKVGVGISKAKFNIPSYIEVRALLKEMGKVW